MSSSAADRQCCAQYSNYSSDLSELEYSKILKENKYVPILSLSFHRIC